MAADAELSERLHFIGLGEAERAALTGAAPDLQRVLPAVLEATDDSARQVGDVQAETRAAVVAIGPIVGQIREMSQTTAAIAAAAAQQEAARQEIARNVSEAAIVTRDVTANIGGLGGTVRDTGNAADGMVAAMSDLSAQSQRLRENVETFRSGAQAA